MTFRVRSVSILPDDVPAPKRDRVIPPEFFEQQLRPVKVAETAAPEMDLQAARRRLRKEPVSTWRESFEKFSTRTQGATAKVAELQRAFDGASQDVARDVDGAQSRQDELHAQLTQARGDLEKARAALDVAKAQLAESEKAQQIVQAAERQQERQEKYDSARREVGEATAAHEKALANLRECDRTLREKVRNAIALRPIPLGGARFDLEYSMCVCYAGRGVLPVTFPPGLYDKARNGFTGPDSLVPPAEIPSFAVMLSNHI